MRLTRLLLLSVVALGAAACSEDDGVTINTRPPLGGVRFINAVPDGGPVDIRMIDQVEWSANSVSTSTNYGLPFRAGTIHWPTEAKSRRIRVFPTDSNVAVTSQILHDTTIAIEPNKNVTLMLVGSRAAGGSVRFVMIDDTPPALTGNQIAVRAVNAGAAASVNGYLTATATTALPGSATWPAMALYTPGAYVTRDTGTFAVRATAAGAPATIWSATAPAGAPASGLISATAGFRAAGSGLSAYVFPTSVAGTKAPQTSAFTSPAIVYFVDRIPGPVVAASTP